MNQEQMNTLITQIQGRLSDLSPAGVTLSVDASESRFEDDWLYICVGSNMAGVRVSDFAELFSHIETELRSEFNDNIILVPVISV